MTREVLRAFRRLVLGLVWTALMLLARLGSLCLGVFSSGKERSARRGIFRLWGKGICAIANVKLQVQGVPPKAPFITVSNHLSFFDVVLLGRTLGCVFVAKSEVRNWPIIGFITRTMNTIFIDRQRVRDTQRVNRLVSRALDQGYGVHLFAEGGIVSVGGQTVEPFKSAIFEPAAHMGYPVHYAVVTYRTEHGSPPASQNVVWPKGMSFARHVLRFLKLREFYATVTFGERPIAGNDRKVLARQLWEAVKSQYVPVK